MTLTVRNSWPVTRMLYARLAVGFDNVITHVHIPTQLIQCLRATTNLYLARAKVCCWSFPLSILTSRSSALAWSCSFSWLQVETYIQLNIYYMLACDGPWRKSVDNGGGVPEQVWLMLFKPNSIPVIYLHVCL